MKKLLAIILMISMIFVMTSCELVDNIMAMITGTTTTTTTTQPQPDVPDTYLYNDFTYSEKAIIKEITGGGFFFQPNNEYYLEEYDDDYEDEGIKEIGFVFQTVGNTSDEFEKYKENFSDYTADGTEEDEYGDTWYYFTAADESHYADMAYYVEDGESFIVVYVYYYAELDDNGDNGGDGGNTGDDDPTTDGFTSEEKALIKKITGGALIPFLSADEYYLEEYTDSETYAEYGIAEHGVNFYTFGNTQAEFDAYRALFSDYTFDGTEEDYYGDTWYYFNAADESYCVDMVFYQNDDGDYVVDVYVFYFEELEDGGNTGGDTTTDIEIITNDGKGLPTGTDGVYDVDFTKAENVKYVKDQGYYLDGCPTTGSPAVLVIPVEFSDVTAASKGYSIDKIKAAFEKNGKTDYYSVYDFYYLSSYGQLTLDITVLDEWFRPSEKSTYYEQQTMDYYGSQTEIGDQMIIHEALTYLEGKMDLSKFDSDGDGIIDAIVIINTLEVGDDNFHWAYRYWNIYTDKGGEYYQYDEVSANDYLWACYQFLYETYDENGKTVYEDTVMNTYTYIHEFGHVLGLDDYYDTSGNTDGPLEGYDVMDSMTGDHSPFSKFNLGWITTSRLVTTNGSVTLTLQDFSKAGDTIIIANNWDEKLGAYQEYYVLMYYKNTGLNAGDGGYFENEGVVVYHVNSSLYKEVGENTTYYDVYNNNTDSSDSTGYGTENDLVGIVKSKDDTFVYVVGSTMPETKDDGGNILGINFTVDSIADEYVTLTFTAK